MNYSELTENQMSEYTNNAIAEAIEILNGAELGANNKYECVRASGDYIRVSITLEMAEDYRSFDLEIICFSRNYQQPIDWQRMPPIRIKMIKQDAPSPTYVCRLNKRGYGVISSLPAGDFQLEVKAARDWGFTKTPDTFLVKNQPQGLAASSHQKPQPLEPWSPPAKKTEDSFYSHLKVHLYAKKIGDTEKPCIAFEATDLTLDGAEIQLTLITEEDHVMVEQASIKLGKHPTNKNKLRGEWICKPLSQSCELSYELIVSHH